MSLFDSTLSDFGNFNRVVKLRIYAAFIAEDTTPPFVNYPFISYSNTYTEFCSQYIDSAQPEGFRITAKAILQTPTVGFATNNIFISIRNLGATSRSIIQSKVGTRIELFAGYNKNVPSIAKGDILWANTHKEGTDYITEIIAGDSQYALTNGLINTSFEGPVTYEKVINTLVAALAPNQVYANSIRGVPEGGYNNGKVLIGSPFDRLAEICAKLNLSLNVIGGGININPKGQDNGSPVIELSEATGMVFIPELQTPGVIGAQSPGVPVTPDNDLSFVHLIRPDLKLSQRVRIFSKFIQGGEYIILHAVNEVDSWSGPFYTRCQCAKVTNPLGVTGV